MLTPLENGFGLDIVIWLQAHGGPSLDVLAHLLNIMGGSLFALVVGPLFYWSVDKRLGQQMVTLLLAGVLVTVVLKGIAQTPRPYVAHPADVHELFTVEGGGIPSGHVINAIMFWFPAAAWLNRRRWWWLYGGYVLLVAWSRMYAGVHYPQDVAVSLVVGPLMVVAYRRGAIKPETFGSPVFVGGITMLALVLIPLAWSYDDGLTAVGAIVGLAWGLWLETRALHFTLDGSRGQRARRYGLGLVMMLAIFFGLRMLFSPLEPAAIFRVVRYGLVVLFAAAGWPWMWRQIGV